MDKMPPFKVGDFLYVKRLSAARKEIRRKEGTAAVYSRYLEGYTIKFLGDESKLYYAEASQVRPLSHKESEAAARVTQFLLTIKPWLEVKPRRI